VRSAAALVPSSVSAKAVPFKRLGIAFGRRFFLLLLMGFVWLACALADPRFVYAMLLWDFGVVCVWAADLVWLARPSDLEITRSWSEPVALSVPSEVRLSLKNGSRRTVCARLLDNVPVALRDEAPTLEVAANGQTEAGAGYEILPVRRGDVSLGSVFIRYQSPLRIAERWGRADLTQKICVYPNLREAQRHSIYLIRSRQIDLEKRHSRSRGLGREFESLREYQEGDDFRDICWSASARRGKLITRLYQMERSQAIWVALDCGRLMRTRVETLSKLDCAVNAALSVAQVALGSGDRVGLMCYGQKVRDCIPPYRGGAHLRELIQHLALADEESGEADHQHAASVLLSSQRRRSLIIWLTDLAETAMTPEVVQAVGRMLSRHVVMFVLVGQTDEAWLANAAPSSTSSMYLTAAAQEMMQRREELLAKLRHQGAQAFEISGKGLSTAVINSYLQVKERGLL
jgi:uncharacterized protein (DUF58 family)